MSSNIINNSNSSCQSTKGVLMVEKKPTTRPQEQLNCPRCNSTNTKFCYYNNYSLTQPRYFCKTCRRYWTEGGSLRNVPVGGGSRKNKRLPTTATTSSLSTSLVAAATAPSSSVSSFRLPDLNPPSLISQFNTTSSPHVVDGSCGKELNLGFPLMQDSNQAMELLRSTGVASRGLLSSFMPTLMPADSNAVLFSSGLGDHPDQEFKPNNLSFSIDHGIEGQSDGAKIFFPFGELKHEFPRTATTDHDHEQSKKSQDHETTTNTPPSGSCWSGMLDHGGSW